MSDHCLTLDIGGLGVALACRRPALAEKLSRRYAGFAASASPAFHAEIAWQPGQLQDAPFLPPDLHWETEDSLRFSAPGCRGWISLAEARAALHITSRYPVEGVDYFLRVVYALLAFRAGGALFHTAAIVRRGAAYLFFGPSGSGKSTVSALSPSDRVLNDDLVLLLPQGGAWQAHATPFWNPTQVRPTPGHAPVRAFLRLVQSSRLRLEPLGGAAALAEFLSCLPLLPANPALVPALLALGGSILARVPMYRLYFPKDDTFWTLVETLA